MTEAMDFLREAIDRNSPAALALVLGDTTRLTRSRLLEAADNGIWVGLPTGQAEVVDTMLRAGQPVRVTFKRQQSHVEFHAPILERARAHRLNATTLVEAVRLAWPTRIDVVQRRAAYRAAVATEDDVTFRFWRIAADADLATVPPAAAELNVDVRDFSVSGVGGIWKRRRGEDPVLPCDQRLRVDVITPATTVTLEAYARFLAGLPEPEYRRLGVQFMLGPTNLADRAKVGLLNRITGELQRSELKRLRVAR